MHKFPKKIWHILNISSFQHLPHNLCDKFIRKTLHFKSLQQLSRVQNNKHVNSYSSWKYQCIQPCTLLLDSLYYRRVKQHFVASSHGNYGHKPLSYISINHSLSCNNRKILLKESEANNIKNDRLNVSWICTFLQHECELCWCEK